METTYKYGTSISNGVFVFVKKKKKKIKSRNVSN